MKKTNRSQSRTDVSAALKSAGMQVTAQRLAVYRALAASPHAMADEIYQAVQDDLGVISK